MTPHDLRRCSRRRGGTSTRWRSRGRWRGHYMVHYIVHYIVHRALCGALHNPGPGRRGGGAAQPCRDRRGRARCGLARWAGGDCAVGRAGGNAGWQCRVALRVAMQGSMRRAVRGAVQVAMHCAMHCAMRHVRHVMQYATHPRCWWTPRRVTAASRCRPAWPGRCGPSPCTTTSPSGSAAWGASTAWSTRRAASRTTGTCSARRRARCATCAAT